MRSRGGGLGARLVLAAWMSVIGGGWGLAEAQPLSLPLPKSGLGTLSSASGCPDEIELRLRALEETQPMQAAEIRRLLCQDAGPLGATPGLPQPGRGRMPMAGTKLPSLQKSQSPGLQPQFPSLTQPAPSRDLTQQPFRSEPPGPHPEASSAETFFTQGALADPNAPVEQFGYELFSRDPSAFVPSVTALIGPEYRLGPDDELTVMMWGLIDVTYSVRVSREGTVVFPRVGEVPVAGIPYGELKAHLERAFARHYKNFQLSVTMGQLRSIQVYVVGEVKAPGSYSVSSLSSMFTALFASGGPKKSGTLRDIQLLRNGKIVKHLDLYEFLLKGDKSQDVRLQDQDTVFVPLIGPVAAVTGQVQRPAIYELAGSATIGDLLALSGGIQPTSYLTKVQIERVLAHQKRVALDYDFLTHEGGAAAKTGAGKDPDAKQLNQAMLQVPVQNMDRLRVFPINAAIQQAVYLKGHVVRPGAYQFTPGMHVTDLIRSLDDLKSDAFTKAELSRYSVGERRTLMETRTVDLVKSLAGDPDHNLELKSLDILTVRPVPPTDIGWEVLLKGEVQRPGVYTITQGERLSSVLKRAGGFTKSAFPKGSLFLRESVKALQASQIQKLSALQAQRATAESSALAVGGLDKIQMDAQKELLAAQKETPQQQGSLVTLGRMVVKVDDPDRLAGTPEDILLENGDVLDVPGVPETVNVLGSVRNPTALLFRPNTDASEYLRQAGGLTADAEVENAYVLKADGSAVALYPVRSYQTHIGGNGQSAAEFPVVERGDAIVVPSRIEVRTRPAPVWQAVPDPSEAMLIKK